jgi:hypothetical protein
LVQKCFEELQTKRLPPVLHHIMASVSAVSSSLVQCWFEERVKLAILIYMSCCGSEGFLYLLCAQTTDGSAISQDQVHQVQVSLETNRLLILSGRSAGVRCRVMR